MPNITDIELKLILKFIISFLVMKTIYSPFYYKKWVSEDQLSWNDIIIDISNK